MGSRPRSQLDRLRPDVSQRVSDQQSNQKEAQLFIVGDAVYVWNLGSAPRWLAQWQCKEADRAFVLPGGAPGWPHLSETCASPHLAL